MRISILQPCLFFGTIVEQLTILALVLATVIPGVADAALISRLGGRAIYDSDRDLTWIADANLAATHAFGTAGINPLGLMSWSTAKNWIAAMNSADYLGYSDWRLPATDEPDPTCTNLSLDGVSVPGGGQSCSASDMGHLFYIEHVSQATPELFSNVQLRYWSATEVNSFSAWTFDFAAGTQDIDYKVLHGNLHSAWAVRSGEVAAAVPEPAGILFILAGMAGIVLLRRAGVQVAANRCLSNSA